MTESDLKRYMQDLMEETGSPKNEVARLAFALGLRQLWRTHTLSRYRSGALSREAAVESAGAAWVEFSDRQHQSLTADLAWALDQDEDEDEEGGGA